MDLTDEQKKFIAGWSWGAIFGGWYYRYHKKYLRDYSAYPFTNYFGSGCSVFVYQKTARRLMWELGEWHSFDQFYNVEKKIDKAGKIITVVIITFFVILFTGFIFSK